MEIRIKEQEKKVNTQQLFANSLADEVIIKCDEITIDKELLERAVKRWLYPEHQADRLFFVGN